MIMNLLYDHPQGREEEAGQAASYSFSKSLKTEEV